MLRFSSLILVIGRGRGRSGLGDLSWAEALSFRRLGSTIDEIALAPTSVAAALPGGIECDFTVDFLLVGWRHLSPSRSIAVEDVPPVGTAMCFSWNCSLGLWPGL